MFAITAEKHPARRNNISGKCMMAISGGAVIPLLVGWVRYISGSMVEGMSILILCRVYLLSVSVYSLRSK
jgi:FHS family L-fucose permease-like MFS transporter